MKYGRHFVIVTILVLVSTVVAYFLLSAIYQLPVAASSEAVAIDSLFRGHFFLIAALFSLVAAFMGYSLFAFRRRPGDDEEEEGDHFHGHTGLEIAWTIVPLGLVLFFGVWGAQMLGDITRAEPENEMVVRVIGQQWRWDFEYPELDDLRTEELVLPVDQKVRLEMESQDVLHAFWVPEFRVKQDLVPGRVTELRINPTEIGDYKVRCAEICGGGTEVGHATMLAPVRVVSQSEYDAWAEEQLAAAVDVEGLLAMSAAERGQMWSQQFACTGCHSVDGSVLVGPSWQGLFGHEVTFTDGSTTTADEEYLRNAILNPADRIVEGFNNQMPGNFAERFAEEEAKYNDEIDILEDLIAYIETLE